MAIAAANTDTALAATGLSDGSYKLYTADAAGNCPRLQRRCHH